MHPDLKMNLRMPALQGRVRGEKSSGYGPVGRTAVLGTGAWIDRLAARMAGIRPSRIAIHRIVRRKSFLLRPARLDGGQDAGPAAMRFDGISGLQGPG
jgi:hypothetical protein